MSSEMTSPPEPVAVWVDESGRLMSDLGSVDTQCHATVRARHCPTRAQCVLLHRAPGPRLLFGELMSELDDEPESTWRRTPKGLTPTSSRSRSTTSARTVRPAAGDTGCCRCDGRPQTVGGIPMHGWRCGRTSGAPRNCATDPRNCAQIATLPRNAIWVQAQRMTSRTLTLSMSCSIRTRAVSRCLRQCASAASPSPERMSWISLR